MDPDVYEASPRRGSMLRDNPDVWVAIVTGAGDKAYGRCRPEVQEQATPPREPISGSRRRACSSIAVSKSGSP